MPDYRTANNRVSTRNQSFVWFVLVVTCWAVSNATANPLIAAGDAALRADIQVLADYGVIKGPVTTWPLAWGPILSDIGKVDRAATVPSRIASALARVEGRARWETAVGELHYNAMLSGAENPARIRSFADTPREAGALGGGFSWTGNLFSVNLNGQIVSSPDDGDEYRADGSMLGVALGNFSVAVSTMDRWWGPGWDGSLILSNNARPIPALTIDRNFTPAFETRWLSWLGPWDLSMIAGQMERERVVPDTRFLGFRFTFRPFQSLEIGLSRTAQWCGEGRPCNFESFTDLLLGRDNRGDGGIDQGNEPGNQLAGIDFRWSAPAFEWPLAVYGQFIGEDEAGGFPSRYLAQFGIETSGLWRNRWSYRWFAEVSDTSCGFYEADDNFNCAYNHSIYRSGYRYRGRVIGHGSDNDARLLSTGIMLIDENETEWRVLARYGELNRGGAPDTGNSLTATPQDIASLDIAYGRRFRYGVVEIGAGIERIEDSATAETENDVRAFIRWRSSK